MAEITQQLGFDARQAIQALRQLDQELGRLNTSLLNVANGGFASFNRQARGVLDTFGRLQLRSAETRRSLQNLNVPGSSFQGLDVARQRIDQTHDSAQRLRPTITRFGQAAQQAGNQVVNAANRGARANQSLVLSFETLSRIILAQVVVRAIGGLQSALTDAVTRAREFQRTIAEIQTIETTGRGFGAIANDVQNLSDAFGVDLGDVGRGLYQTISNQIAQTGTSAERAAGQYNFLSDAIKFSIAGVTSVENSVNLLAGTLNAYGLEADRAGQLSAQFFKTVELGRTTVGELAQQFATVAPIAAQLGVSTEELNASFASITIGGLDTAKAATQIRGAMTALLKPTTDMKEAFEALGIANAEQGIELFGFQGLLESVIGTTDGTAESISRLIPRIRGLSGVLRLASAEGAVAYQRSLEQIIAANEEVLDRSYSIVFDAPSVRLERDLNKIRNFLTRDFGESIVQVANRIIQSFGGVDNIVQAFDALLAPIEILTSPAGLVGVGAVITAIGARALVASRNVGLLGRSLSFLAAAGVAVSVGTFIGSQISDFINAESNARLEAAEERKRIANEAATAERNVEEAKNKQIVAGVKSLGADLAQANADRIRNARRTLQQEIAANENAFRAILGASEELESRLRSQFESREDQARDAVDNIRDAEQELSDARFEAQTRGLNDQQKFFATERRLAEEQARVRQQLASQAVQQGDEDAIDRLREQQERVQELAGSLQNLASASGDRRLQFRADQAVQQGLQNRIQLEQQLINILNRRRQIEKAAADEVAENNRQAAVLLEQLIKAQEAAFEAGLAPEEEERRFEEFAARRREFFDNIQRSAQVGAKELADFSNVLTSRGFQGILEEELSQAEIDRLAISETALLSARTDLENALRGSIAEVDVQLRAGLEEAGFELSIEGVVQGVQAAVQEDEIINQARREIERLEDNIERQLQDLPNVEQRVIEELGLGGRGGLTESEQALKRLVDRFNLVAVNALKDGILTDLEIQQIDLLREQLKNAREELGFFESVRFNFAFSDEVALTNELVQNLRNVVELQNELQKQRETLQRAEETLIFSDESLREAVIQGGARTAENQRAKEAAEAEKQAIDQVGTAGETASNKLSLMSTQIDNATLSVNQLRQALENLPTPDLNLPTTTPQAELAALGKKIRGFSKGGLVSYFADGGFTPRGTDTVPAMLSPGEYVVNARSTRKFFSELQSINAGVRPVYRQEGGPVTNVGDISVTVQGGQESAQTGREIARSLRRELRRKTSQLS